MNDKHISKDTVKSPISATTGGQLVVGDFQIVFPPSAFVDTSGVSGKHVEDIPPIVTEAMEAEGVSPADIMILGGVYDINLGDTSLLATCSIKMRCDPKTIPANHTLGNIKIVQHRDGEWCILRTFFDDSSNTLHADTDHFSLLGVISLSLGKAMLVMVGSGIVLTAVALRKLLSLGDPDYLEPDKVDTSGFRVDVRNRRLEIDGKSFKMIVGFWDRYRRPKRPSKMLAEKTPRGMCIDFANLFGSLLIKEGHPVRLVQGTVTYRKRTNGVEDPNLSESGGHLWVETVIDGQPYYVDTYDKNVTLVPLEEAYERFSIRTGVSYWKEYKDGKYESFRPEKEHNRDWWKNYVEVILILDKSKTMLFIEEGETEREVTFVAHVIPGLAMRQDGLYYSEWDFVDGKPVLRNDFDFGQTLAVTRSYTNLKDGDVLEVFVRIMNEEKAEKATVAHESVMIKVLCFARKASEDIWNRIDKAKERLEKEKQALQKEYERLRRERNEVGKTTPELREALQRIQSQGEILHERQRILYDIDQEHKVWGRDKRWKSTLEIVELVLGRWSTGITKEIAQEMAKVDSSTSEWMRRIRLERVSDMRNKWKSVFESTRMLFLD